MRSLLKLAIFLSVVGCQGTDDTRSLGGEAQNPQIYHHPSGCYSFNYFDFEFLNELFDRDVIASYEGPSTVTVSHSEYSSLWASFHLVEKKCNGRPLKHCFTNPHGAISLWRAFSIGNTRCIVNQSNLRVRVYCTTNCEDTLLEINASDLEFLNLDERFSTSGEGTGIHVQPLNDDF